LSKLDISKLTSGSGGVSGLGNIAGFTTLFNYLSMIPPYYLQIFVGVYLIEIIFILTSTLVTIDSGEDDLEKKYRTGINLRTGIKLFFITALFSTIVLGILVTVVLPSV
jgi:hypothetical protein